MSDEQDPPDVAREWVLKAYRDGDHDFVGVTSDEWRLAVTFCEHLANCEGTRTQISIVPKRHVSSDYAEAGIAVIYEGHTDAAERIQLGDDSHFGAHMAVKFREIGCHLEMINSWSTSIVREIDENH